jgi:hypothetical protein
MEIGRPKVREQDGDGGGWGWVGYLNSLTHDWVVGVVCVVWVLLLLTLLFGLNNYTFVFFFVFFLLDRLGHQNFGKGMGQVAARRGGGERNLGGGGPTS